MVTVLIESNQFNDLKVGNPLLVRTTLSMLKYVPLKKGDPLQIVCDSLKLNATIISDPVVMVSEPEEGYKEVSLEIIKSEYARYE